MNDDIELGFKRATLTIPLEKILPSKTINKAVKRSVKYKQIVRTLSEFQLVEPLVVYPQTDNFYLLLDGHLRYNALLELKRDDVRCLIAKDDETFTYNKHINRLATIQEHYMIIEAVKRGVSEKRLADVLGIDVKSVQQKKSLLTGICPEVVEMLKHQTYVGGTLRVLKKMKPLRQIEVVELMAAANNYTATYAKALLVATPKDQLVDADVKKKMAGITEEQAARMENEMSRLQRDIKGVEDYYGLNLVKLAVIAGYLKKLFSNTNISHYLERHHNELYAQLKTTVTALEND